MRKGRIKYYFKNKNAVINDVGKLCDMNEQLEQELEKYKNIIDELKEDLPCLLEIINRNEKDIKVYQDEWIAIKSIENKLKELKGSDE